MRSEFIPYTIASTFDAAIFLAPWACAYQRSDTGWWCYESHSQVRDLTR